MGSARMAAGLKRCAVVTAGSGLGKVTAEEMAMMVNIEGLLYHVSRRSHLRDTSSRGEGSPRRRPRSVFGSPWLPASYPPVPALDWRTAIRSLGPVTFVA